MTETRLNKYLAECGICSRREADKLIDSGKVYVNGHTATPGQKISENDEIICNGKIAKKITQKNVVAFYKPVGVTCTEKDKHAEKMLSDVFRYPVRLTYAGRLDKDSEGLLLLSNDGDLIHGMMQGANGHEKEYRVKVDKPITQDFLQKMGEGVWLKELNMTTRPCKITAEGRFTFTVILTQGVNRQIRRMCEAFHYKVMALKRVRVLNIELGNLKPGEYREVLGEELQMLYRIVEEG